MLVEYEKNYFVNYEPHSNNQNNARAPIGQSAVGYCAGKPMEKSRGIARRIREENCEESREEFVNHPPAARGLYNYEFFSCSTTIPLGIFKNWFMLSVRISSYGCTREVWRAQEKRKS